MMTNSVCTSINNFVILSVKKVLKLKTIYTELHTDDIQTNTDLFLHGAESGTGALDASIS